MHHPLSHRHRFLDLSHCCSSFPPACPFVVVSGDEVEFGCRYGLVRDLVQITMMSVLNKTLFGVVSFKSLSPSVWRWWLCRFVVMLCFGLLMRLFSSGLFTVHVSGFHYYSFFSCCSDLIQILVKEVKRSTSLLWWICSGRRSLVWW